MCNMVRSLVLLLALAPALPAQQLDTTAINKVFESYSNPNSPGCVLGIGRSGRVLYQRGYGMANLEYDVPLTAQTIVEIGSVSKQFTAAAILLLAQRGTLSLDDDIRKWLPEVPDFGAKITIRMLANHTSGLRDQWGLLGMMNSPPGSAVHTPELVLDLVTRQRDLNFKPNEQYLYSNTGYTLLGIIVKRASGKSLAEYTRDNIFQPLGMSNTQWRDDYTRVVKGRATAYNRSGDAFRQDMPFTNVYGNGGLLTTVRDLIVWWDALYTDKLGSGLLAQLTTSGVLNNKHTISYALGVSNGTYRGLKEITHGGATAGYRAHLVSLPQSKTTVAVLCNNASANTAMHAQRVLDVVMAGQLAPPPAERIAV
ncbi:MAG TPA: serine hydrolase domain-containing protein, partial [Longimicrobiales bacterium]|nr:serine hydrolase domain-containing protein [Longimicrobiales bacterium]